MSHYFHQSTFHTFHRFREHCIEEMSPSSIKWVLGVATVFVSILIKLPNADLDWQLVQDLGHNYSTQVHTPSTTQVSRSNVKINNLNPLKEVVIVISGATSGIGKSLAIAACKLGTTIVAIGRSPTKLLQLKEELLAVGLGGTNIFTVTSDFSDFESVSKASDEIKSLVSSVDVLINNAAINCLPDSNATTETIQGYDICFSGKSQTIYKRKLQSFIFISLFNAVNYLSHVLLTEKLIPLLQKSKLKSPRIVQVSSSIHWLVDETNLIIPSSFHSTKSHMHMPVAAQKSNKDMAERYADSKLAQILYGRALERKLNQSSINRIKVVSVSPGMVHTNILKKKLGQFYLKTFGYSSDGIGIMSILNAMFRDIHDKQLFFTNTNVSPYIYGLIPTSKCASRIGLRSASVKLFSLCLTMSQKFVYSSFQISKSSPESYNVTVQDDLYSWSTTALEKWLLT